MAITARFISWINKGFGFVAYFWLHYLRGFEGFDNALKKTIEGKSNLKPYGKMCGTPYMAGTESNSLHSGLTR